MALHVVGLPDFFESGVFRLLLLLGLVLDLLRNIERAPGARDGRWESLTRVPALSFSVHARVVLLRNVYDRPRREKWTVKNRRTHSEAAKPRTRGQAANGSVPEEI